jgi:hypothetical protein
MNDASVKFGPKSDIENISYGFHFGILKKYCPDYWDDKYKLCYSYGQDLANEEIKLKLKSCFF